jgi:hypothetical protein
LAFEKNFHLVCVTEPEMRADDDFCVGQHSIKDESHAFANINISLDMWMTKMLSYWEAIEVKAVHDHIAGKMALIHQSELFRGEIAEVRQKISLAYDEGTFVHSLSLSPL